MNSINEIFNVLLKTYKKQGWWPIINRRTLISEYNGEPPKNKNDIFEISIGAILTQSVSWSNVNRSLILIKSKGYLNPKEIQALPNKKLAALIKSTGYYNQKAKKIKNYIEWFEKYNYSFNKIKKINLSILRKELLSINGIGPETADSILLYGLSKKIFPVDAYTKRIFTRIGVLKGSEKYQEIQDIFHNSFKGTIDDYREYHALIVAHGKESCRTLKQIEKKKNCIQCCLRHRCKKNGDINDIESKMCS